MKKTIFLLVSLFSMAVFAQRTDYSMYFKTATKLNASNFDRYINEVYADQADAQRNVVHFQQMRDLIEIRLAVVTLPENEITGVRSTNDVNLLNKYNENLDYDTTCNPDTFNPFKYDLEFYTTNFKAYRIANTNTLLLIAPL